MLFEVFTKTVLLFGSPVWGPSLLSHTHPLTEDRLGPVGTFYRSCLRQLLTIPRGVRNEMVYLLAAQPPLQVTLTKNIHRYVSGLQHNPRLASELAHWVRTIDDSTGRTCMTLAGMVDITALFPDVTSIYRTWYTYARS